MKYLFTWIAILLSCQFRIMHLDVDYPGVKGKNLVALSPQPKVFTPEKPTG